MKKLKTLILVSLVFSTSAAAANFLDGPAVGIYDEKENSPRYKTFDSSFSQEQLAVNIGSYSTWLEAAEQRRGDEAVLLSLTNSNTFEGQIWNGNSWGNSIQLSSSADKNFEGMDVAYESQSGDAVIVIGTYQPEPRYRVWDGSWGPEELALDTSNGYQQVEEVELSSNPSEDELMLLTTGSGLEIDAQIWDGDSWTNQINLGNNVPGSEPIATTFTQNGQGIAVWEASGDSTPQYKVWSGSWGSTGNLEPISGTMNRAELDSHETENEAVLATIDSNGDMEAQIWNGTGWNNHTQLESSVSSATEAIDVEYTHSGEAMVMYSDGSSTPKYVLWNGTEWSNEKTSLAVQGTPEWIELSSHPNTDEVLANVKDGNNKAYLQVWDGSSWVGDGGNAKSGKSGRVAGFYSVADNELPEIGTLTGPAEVKTGGSISIDAENVTDAENDNLELYCSYSQNPDASNAILGTAPEDGSPYDLSYSYAVQETEGEKTVFCRVKDGFGYSTNENFSYTIDGTPPQISLVSVADDKTATFTDTEDNGQTEIVVDGEDNMSCRYSQTDEAYSEMPSGNSFSVTNGRATATPDPTQGTPDYYVSCKDDKGNEQTASNNLDITSIVVDFTPPTTFDNAVTDIQTPPYTVTLTEEDNSDGDPETDYCLGTGCTPDKSIDDGGQISFNESDRGTRTLRYNSTDFVGNTQTVQEQKVYINRLPELKNVSDNASTIQGGETVNVTTYSVDPDSRNRDMTLHVCSSLGASASGCSGENLCTATGVSNLSCSFQSEKDSQQHNYYTYLYDANNEPATENPDSGSYTTDSTPPEIVITEPENQTYSQSEIAFRIETDEPLQNAKYELEGTNYSMEEITSDSYTASKDLSDGNYSVTFHVNDSVSNYNSKTRFFEVDTTGGDTTPPSLTVRSPTNNSYYNSSILLNVTSNEDLSDASYSIDSGAFQSLGNVSNRFWNKTVTPVEGEHTVVFNGTDTAGNTAQTEKYEVDYDVSAPVLEASGVEDPDNTENTTCYSKWSDRNLDTGKVYENRTDTNHSVSFNNGYLNYSFSPEPGAIKCRFYATDKAGNTASKEIVKTIQDVKKPVIESFKLPSEEEADPGKQLNFTAQISDYSVDTVTLQYNRTSGYQNSSMVNNSGTFKGNFTGSKGNYTVRLFTNDTSGNTQYSDEKNISVAYEERLSVNNTIGAPRTSRLESGNGTMDLGNITLRNKGDLALNLSATSNRDWIEINGSENPDIDLSAGEDQKINVSANTTGFPTGEFGFNILITGNKSSNISESVLIQKERGPSLNTRFTKFSSQLTKGTVYEYVVEAENSGTTNAESTRIELDVPDSFDLVSGSENRTVGEILVGGTATTTLKLKPTEGDAEYTLNAKSVSSTDTDSVSRTVTVGTPPEPETVEETEVVSGGSPETVVSGGTARLTQRQSDRLFETEQDFEVVRGTDRTFSVSFTNPIDYRLENVTVEIDGFLSQYLELETVELGDMEVNETREIELNVTAPDYYNSERKELVFTVKGVGDTGLQSFDLTEKKTVNLFIREISKERAEKLFRASGETTKNLSESGYRTEEVEKLLESMNLALESKDYSRVKDVHQEIERTASEARKTRTSIQKLERSIQESERKGIRPERSRQTLKLAEEAMERGDFETASSRLNEAQDLYALETKGEFNAVNFLIRNKFKASGATLAVLFTSLFGFYRFRLNRMQSRLEDLKLERDSINEQIKDLQKKAFRTEDISLKKYENRLSDHKDRLVEISEEQVALVSKMSAWQNFRDRKSRLQQEKEKVNDLIKETQRNYVDRDHISSESFEKREQKYRERLTEIKEELAEIEAHERIGGGSYLP